MHPTMGTFSDRGLACGVHGPCGTPQCPVSKEAELQRGLTLELGSGGRRQCNMPDHCRAMIDTPHGMDTDIGP